MFGINNFANPKIHREWGDTLRPVWSDFTQFAYSQWGLASRGIDWQQQGLRGSLAICIGLASKLFSNLLARCDNIAVAMTARGFQGPQRHVLHAATPPPPSGVARWLPSLADWGLLLCLGLLTAASHVVL